MVRILAAVVTALTLSCVVLAQGPVESSTKAQPIGKQASDLDRQVLQALLLTVRTDPGFPAPAKNEKSAIVLHQRTPKLIDPIVNAAQLSYETGGRVLPKDAWDDLVRRNLIRLSPDSRIISYEGLNFDSSIQVGNAFPGPEPPFLGKTFEDVFPQARGWVEAWVPGYSKDGKTAIVRARVGPTEKWATLTAIMKLQQGKWTVAWKKYSIYN